MVVLADATWKAGSSASASRLRRVAARALDHRDAHYCVLSREEAGHFPANWGVAPERVHSRSFHWVLDEREVEESRSRSGGVFAGGDSLRDYGPLLEAAEACPPRVTIASSTAAPARVPANVTLGALPAPRLRRAVPRRIGRRRAAQAAQRPQRRPADLPERDGAGQARGGDRRAGRARLRGARRDRPPRSSGRPRRPPRALAWILDPANEAEVHAVAERGRRAALERFGPNAYVERLLDVLDRALGARAARDRA